MSNAGQAALGIVGAVVGFVVSGFNPMGAVYGAQLGLLAGSADVPTQLPSDAARADAMHVSASRRRNHR